MIFVDANVPMYLVGDAHPNRDRSLDRLVNEVLGFGRADVLEARNLLDSIPRLSARDAIHLAVMRREGVSRIPSFDQAFDEFPEVERVS